MSTIITSIITITITDHHRNILDYVLDYIDFEKAIHLYSWAHHAHVRLFRL
jgi:hypothetical protein